MVIVKKIIIIYISLLLILLLPGIVSASSSTYLGGTADVLSTEGSLYLNTNNASVSLDTETGNLSGYGWSNDIGWIDFDNAGAIATSAKINMTTGIFEGKAVAVNTGKYLDFSNYGSNVKLDFGLKEITGYGWSEDIGWIDFNGVILYSADSAIKPIITQIGLIKNIPDKDKLYYYFTANRVRIWGTSEKYSEIFFAHSNGTTYKTQADIGGKFYIVIDLLNGENELTYYSINLASNRSINKILILNIDPTYGLKIENNGELIPEVQIVESSEKETETVKENSEEVTPPIEAKKIRVIDLDGNPIINKLITIEGIDYITDSFGYIYINEEIVGDFVLYDGKSYPIKLSGEDLILDLSSQKGSFNYLYCFFPLIALLLIVLTVVIVRRKKIS